MDDFWVDFNNSKSSESYAYVASNETVSVLCSYGKTESDSFRQMANILGDTNFSSIVAQSGCYIDD